MINPINLLAWNIKGISRRDSQRYLQHLYRSNNVHLLILLEPMSDVSLLDSIKSLLRFDNAQSFIDGKIWVMWFDEFSIKSMELAE